MKLILLGAPGAGKGTQGKIICQRLGIPVIGTGNIIREAVANGTPAGREAKSYMEKGHLVPDEVVIAMVRERLAKEDCKNGFLLDGFPRTIAQAEALEEMVHIDKVIDLEVDDQVIKERLAGRRVCEKCGDSYHITNNPPKVEGVCDSCGGRLIIRKDDDPATIESRLAVYHRETKPLTGYYQAKGILEVIRGTNDLEGTTRQILAAVEA